MFDCRNDLVRNSATLSRRTTAAESTETAWLQFQLGLNKVSMRCQNRPEATIPISHAPPNPRLWLPLLSPAPADRAKRED